LQALALNQEEPEQINDCLMPDYKGMQKKFGKVIGKFKDIFYDGEEIDPQCAPVKPKGRGKTLKRT